MLSESLLFHLSRSDWLRILGPFPVLHVDDPVTLVAIAVTVTLWRKCRSNSFPRPIKVSAVVTAWGVGHFREHFSEIKRRHEGERS